MALSGSFTTSGSGNYALNYSTLTFSWSATQSIAQNKSTVSWTLTVSTGGGTYYSRYVKVDGAVKHGYGVPYQDYSPGGTYYSSGTQLASGSFDIYHNSDGTGSFSVDVGACIQYSYWYMNPSYQYYGQSDTGNWNSKGSKTFVLDTIPRNPATVTGVTISNTKYESNTYVVGGYSTSTLNISTTLGDAPSISKYVVKYGNTVLYDGSSSTPSFKVPNVSGNSASITYKVYAIDSYGLTSNTFTCTAFTAYKYTSGSFTSSPLSQRCTSGGTLNEEGKYAKCVISFSQSKIGTNNITTTCKATINSYNGSTTTSPTNIVIGNNNLLESNSYTVVYSLSDSVVSNFTTSTDTISVSFHTINIHGSGKGVAFGQAAAQGYFDVNNMTIRFGGSPWLDLVYPVGSIYMSVNSTSPATLFGGTWSQIQGRFLLGAGANEANTDNTYGTLTAGQINRTAGEKGGSKDDVPAHTHTVNAVHWNSPSQWCTISEYYGNVDHSTTTGSTGNANGVLPPYLVVYMWQRTA